MKSTLWFFLLITLPFNLVALADKSASPSTYGQLYIEEDKERLSLPWRLDLAFGYGLNHPYFDFSSVRLSFERGIGDYLGIGIAGSKFFFSRSELGSSLERAIERAYGGRLVLQADYPSSALSIYASFVPITGRLNFFALYDQSFDVQLDLGPTVFYTQKGKSLFGFFWGVGPKVEVYPGFDLGIHFRQEYVFYGDVNLIPFNLAEISLCHRW